MWLVWPSEMASKGNCRRPRSPVENRDTPALAAANFVRSGIFAFDLIRFAPPRG